MPNFKKFAETVSANFKSLAEQASEIYITDVSGDELYELYLSSYPVGTNEIYKTRTENDCSCCKHFIRHYGNIVFIVQGKSVTFWAVNNIAHPYDIVANALAERVSSAKIVNILACQETNLGTPQNMQLEESGTVKTWSHLHSFLPKKHVIGKIKSPEAIQGERKAYYDVFKRSMAELTLDAALTILELIEQGSIYRGEESKAAVKEFIKYKQLYSGLDDAQKDLWLWSNSKDNFIAKIRNTAIGTLLIDVSEGLDLDQAVGKFERIMAPTNYKRPQAIITQRMINEAEQTINELGFHNSLGRRHAKPEDISVEHVLFVNRDIRQKMQGGSLLGDLKPTTTSKPKEFAKVQEISIDEFVNKVLPESTSVEVMVENSHSGNFMSLIAPEDKTAPSMLKWGNNFSWTYNGDIADSMKERVKAAGGKVDGVLRFSIQWNEDKKTESDYDAHCTTPNNEHIYYATRGHMHKCSGNLDVDIINPSGKVAVENITWPDIKKMPEGNYKFSINCFSKRNGTGGFSAEVECMGKLLTFDHPRSLKQNENVLVAEVSFTKKNGIEFVRGIEHGTQSKDIWGVKTNEFTKVSMVTISPNYWGEVGVGNKHYFFILDRCLNDGVPRGFFNEFLRGDLDKHKRVFEALGSKMRVPASNVQLSGLGFSSTQNNSVVIRVEGKSKRTLKVVF